MIKHRIFIALTLGEIVLLITVILHSFTVTRPEGLRSLQKQRELVRVLGLTDCALWTEARYTRNPSQADCFAPFQDGPSSLDRFPAGSLVPPRERGSVCSGQQPSAPVP